MNAIQSIAAAATLQALCDALNAYRPEDHDGRTLEESIDLSGLPTFGSDEPADTHGIYSYNDTHFLVPSAGEGYELEAREIRYWLRQDDDTCIHQGSDPFDSLAEAEAKAGLADVQKNLGWTDLKIVRAEEINGSIHESTVAWGLDAGDLCVMADVSEAGAIKISEAAETESWGDVREAADKIEFVQRLQCGWANYTGHYQVWAHGNHEPLNYLVAEAAETEADE